MLLEDRQWLMEKTAGEGIIVHARISPAVLLRIEGILKAQAIFIDKAGLFRYIIDQIILLF